MVSQHEIESRYARAVGAKAAAFVYADHVMDACARPDGIRPNDLLVDMLGGRGLRVADVRSVVREVRPSGGRVCVDITVPSHFGCRAFDLGADVQFEALDRIAGGALQRKVVAVSACGDLSLPADALDAADLAAIDEGLDTVGERMQRHFDHARALAEYLSCCEGLDSVSYPGLSSHPDHELATRVLLHGFGPAVDFAIASDRGLTAGEFIAHCELNGRGFPAGGARTRLHAPDGAHGRAVRIFAGLDNPLAIAEDLDRAMLRLCDR